MPKTLFMVEVIPFDGLLLMLTDWFARKNLDDTVIFGAIFITGTNQVHSFKGILLNF